MTGGPADITLVTGASGKLGRAVIDALASPELSVRGLGRNPAPDCFPSRWARANLVTGQGLSAAVSGVTRIIHCASDQYRPADDLIALDRLIGHARATGVIHFIFIGIAGTEDAAGRSPYYAAKLEAERMLAGSGLPHTVVRATQFHPFVAMLLSRLETRFALALPRSVSLQPVSVGYVAARVVDHARAAPAGRVADVHGPDALPLEELARTWLAAHGRPKPVVPVPLPFGPLSALHLLHQVSGDGGGLSWEDWLAANHDDSNGNRRARTPDGEPG